MFQHEAVPDDQKAKTIDTRTSCHLKSMRVYGSTENENPNSEVDLL